MTKLQVYIATLLFSVQAVFAETLTETARRGFEGFFGVIAAIAQEGFNSDATSGVAAFVFFLGTFFGVKTLLGLVFREGDSGVDLKGANSARTFVSLAFAFIATLGLVQMAGSLDRFQSVVTEFLLGALLAAGLIAFAVHAIKEWIYGNENLDGQLKLGLSGLLLFFIFYLIAAYFTQNFPRLLPEIFRAGETGFNLIAILAIIAAIMAIIGALRMIPKGEGSEDEPDPEKFAKKEEYEKAKREYKANKKIRNKRKVGINDTIKLINKEVSAIDSLFKDKLKGYAKKEAVMALAELVSKEEQILRRAAAIVEHVDEVNGFLQEQASERGIYSGEKTRMIVGDVIDFDRYIKNGTQIKQMGEAFAHATSELKDQIQVAKNEDKDKNPDYRFSRNVLDQLKAWDQFRIALGSEGQFLGKIGVTNGNFENAQDAKEQIENLVQKIPVESVKQDFLSYAGELMRNTVQGRGGTSQNLQARTRKIATYSLILAEFYADLKKRYIDLGISEEDINKDKIPLLKAFNDFVRVGTYRTLDDTPMGETELRKDFEAKIVGRMP